MTSLLLKCSTYFEVLIRIIKLLNQTIPDRERRRLVGIDFFEVKSSETKGVFYMIDDWTLDRPLVSANVGLHQTPKILSSPLSHDLLWIGKLRLYNVYY